MSAPSSAQDAGQQARALLARSLPGSRRGTVRGHLERADATAAAIWRRWGVGPHQWQIKHLRWFLEVDCRELAPSTKYDRWRTVRTLIVALGRLDDWAPRLRGPWLRPTGEAGALASTGRPAKLPGAGRTTALPDR